MPGRQARELSFNAAAECVSQKHSQHGLRRLRPRHAARHFVPKGLERRADLRTARRLAQRPRLLAADGAENILEKSLQSVLRSPQDVLFASVLQETPLFQVPHANGSRQDSTLAALSFSRK
jgi:hypothetical protein